ncbi:hypothetical protein [Aquipseudomonas ullengensis]|uniref:Uncharacterized protein n=1 Tax=Aquipseudomonas ullengensis TaxID=2759166 RepID=A0A7W4LMS3_9GAMM|nr:hypothetical protein [Pseudomonas ullengensis]MBB2496028.1 hypothetical protein [Pseudomonas ullengensis]
MICLITYSRNGDVRTQQMKASGLPAMPAIHFTVVAAEMGQDGQSLDSSGISLVEHMAQLGITILDVVPVETRSRTSVPR